MTNTPSKRRGLNWIEDAIARKRNVAAVLVPKRLALAIVDEIHRDHPSNDTDEARAKYIRLVSKGGYIGMIMSVPMIVADDVVVCPLTEQELVDAAPRLGVDMCEIRRDRRLHA